MFAHIREDIATAFDRDPAARSTLEVLTCYPGLHAVWAYRVANLFWRHGLRWLGRLTSHIARWLTGIEIHPGATIGRRFFIDHGMGVVIGETTEIGDDVTLYHGVTLGGTTWQKKKRHPTLEDGVIVGAGAKILGPIVIGAHSRIGANSVVLKAVGPHSTVVGIPGTVVGKTETMADGHKINLDHHLMPNPVAEALKHVLQMIDDVNGRIDAIHPQPNRDRGPSEEQLQEDLRREHKRLERFFGEGI